MFGNIGFAELIVLLGIALVLLGPEKFPEFTKIAIRTFRDLRGYINDAKRDITRELNPVKKELDGLSKYDPETYIDKLTEGVFGEDKEKAAPTPDSSLPAEPPREDPTVAFKTGGEPEPKPAQPAPAESTPKETPGPERLD